MGSRRDVQKTYAFLPPLPEALEHQNIVLFSDATILSLLFRDAHCSGCKSAWIPREVPISWPDMVCRCGGNRKKAPWKFESCPWADNPTCFSFAEHPTIIFWDMLEPIGVDRCGFNGFRPGSEETSASSAAPLGASGATGQRSCPRSRRLGTRSSPKVNESFWISIILDPCAHWDRQDHKTHSLNFQRNIFCCNVDLAATEGQLRHRRFHPRKLVWEQQIRLDLVFWSRFGIVWKRAKQFVASRWLLISLGFCMFLRGLRGKWG